MSDLKEPSTLVKKGEMSNALITSSKRGKLSISSIRLLAFMISQIKKTDGSLEKYKIRRHDLTRVLRCSKNILSREINTVCAELATHSVFIDWGDGTKEYSAIAPTILYNDREYWVEFAFNERLKPHLLNLTTQFTKYQLETVFSLKSTYGFYAYMYFKKFLHGKRKAYKFIVDLEEFKGIISATTKYSAYGHFKDRVLTPLQNEFEELADINFTYEEIKKGRKVEKLEFIITKKDHFQPHLDIEEPEPIELTEEQKESLKLKHAAKAYWMNLTLPEQDEHKKILEKENPLFPMNSELGILQALAMSTKYQENIRIS